MAGFRADCRTAAALRAFRFMEEQLWFEGVRLRVVAPKAVQRTALQEYHRADARPVVNRKLLDVEDQCHQNFFERRGAAVSKHRSCAYVVTPR